MQKSFLVYSPEFSRYKFSEAHPFDLNRGDRFMQLLERHHLIDEKQICKPVPADQRKLFWAHSSDYIDQLLRADRGEFHLDMLNYGLGSADCPVFRGVYQFSRLSVGASLCAVEKVLSGECEFCFNPVGGFHHARRAYAEGFCYVNDVNIVIRRLLQEGFKIAYLDFDAHHGNGVEEEFYFDDRVLVVSLHENGKYLFPGYGFETEIGAGPGKGYNINIPLEPGTDDEIYQYVFEQIVVPALKRYEPDFLVVLFGADAMQADPLTHLRLTNNVLADIAYFLSNLKKPWVGLGAGGYNLDETARTWALIWAIITGQEMESDLSTVGGVFLGSTELGVSGFRDLRSYSGGPEKERAMNEARRVCEYLKKEVFQRLAIK